MSNKWARYREVKAMVKMDNLKYETGLYVCGQDKWHLCVRNSITKHPIMNQPRCNPCLFVV